MGDSAWTPGVYIYILHFANARVSTHGIRVAGTTLGPSDALYTYSVDDQRTYTGNLVLNGPPLIDLMPHLEDAGINNGYAVYPLEELFGEEKAIVVTSLRCPRSDCRMYREMVAYSDNGDGFSLIFIQRLSLKI